MTWEGIVQPDVRRCFDRARTTRGVSIDKDQTRKIFDRFCAERKDFGVGTWDLRICVFERHDIFCPFAQLAV